jgi:uncharacterized protein YyaL (SSP411 family)
VITDLTGVTKAELSGRLDTASVNQIETSFIAGIVPKAQHTVVDLSQVTFVASLGIRRVVLPRELSIEEITQLRRETDAELEVFVHGALCLSYSGQCLASAAFGITQEGNFEGANILTRPVTLEELAYRFSLTPEQAEGELVRVKEALRQAREARIKPHRDEKIIVSWNGLMLSALALGAQVLGNRGYYEAAAKAARFMLENLLQGEVLYRSCTAGRVSVPGFAEDYASLALALLDLYETDFDPAWLTAARRLMALLDQNFLDPEDGLYFYVAKDQESPLIRSKSVFDQTIPSGNSLAARVCLKLHRLTEVAPYRERAQTILRAFQGRARENPFGFSHLWTATILYLTPPLDLTLVGDPQDPLLQEMLAAVYRQFLPERRLLLKNPADCVLLEQLAPAARTYGPLGEGPTAYLCHDFTCRPALKDPAELDAKLKQFRR